MTVTTTPVGAAASDPVPETRERAPRQRTAEPLADISATIATARTGTRDDQRGIEVTVEGVVRLRGEELSALVASVVFVPAAASDEDVRVLLARELAVSANGAFALAGRRIPLDRISLSLR